MKKKILGIVLAIAGLTSVGVIHSASKRNDFKNQQNEKYGTYKERLQRAKARGDKKLRSYAALPLYASADLDTARSIYDWVIGEFVFSKSFPADDDGHIVTWYKFKVLETVSQALRPVSDIDSVPAELLPLASDEILVWKTGGSVEIDGMEIEMEEVGFPPFEKSKKYLLIIAVDHAKQAGRIQVGPSGALIVKADDTLEPISKNDIYYKTGIENRYGASVSKLKEKLK
jgi:hypothetical protein